MEENVFVYGTLMFPDVFKEIVGYYPDYINACVNGYERRSVIGQSVRCSYPALVVGGDTLQGKLIKGVSSSAMVLLDQYEGSEYTRIKFDVIVGQTIIKASTYIWNFTSENTLGDIWDVENFYQNDLSNYLKKLDFGSKSFCLS